MRLSTLSLPHYLLGGLSVCILLVILVAGSTSTAAFGLYNPGWDGSRELRAMASEDGRESLVATNTSQYATVEPNETTAVILSPRAYENQSSQRVRSFVRGGGTLVVAGDFRPGANALLRDIGVRTRIHGALVRDEQHYHRSPTLPVATNVNTSALPSVDRLTLNYGSVLTGTANASVLVRTSEFAYLDTNRNDELDDNETLARYPVVAVERVGAGRVIVVSDPSIFLNSMLTRQGNRAFAQWLFGGASTVLFDYSHTAAVPPLVAMLLALKRSSLLQFTVAAALLGTLGLWMQYPLVSMLRKRFQRQSPPTAVTTDEIIAMLEREHPDWDGGRLQTVAKNISELTTESSTDD